MFVICVEAIIYVILYNLHECAFNIYILSHIIYFIVPLTIIVVLAIKAVGFSKVRQTLSAIFTVHYGDVKD